MLVACERCGEPIGAAGLGSAVSCSSCGHQFVVSVQTPPAVNAIDWGSLPGPRRRSATVPPAAPARQFPVFAKRKRHWAKTAMLVCVLAWPVNTIGCAMANQTASTAGFERHGAAYIHRDAKVVMPDWMYEQMKAGAFNRA